MVFLIIVAVIVGLLVALVILGTIIQKKEEKLIKELETRAAAGDADAEQKLQAIKLKQEEEKRKQEEQKQKREEEKQKREEEKQKREEEKQKEKLFVGGSTSSSSYSSSSGPSTGFSSSNWRKSRENDPHTCSNCGKWLSKGVCRRDGSPKSAGDRCNNWE